MAKFERLEPRAEDMPVFDGGIDDEDAEEGSRLPLLIVIALLVLAAFAGVVWLAYTQGVERGRADAPRIIVAQGQAPTKLKIYQQQAPADESADTDTAPPATAMTKAEPAAGAPPPALQQSSPELRPTPTTAAETTVKPLGATQKPAAVASAAPPPPATAVPRVSAPAPAPRVATHGPVQLTAPPSAELASTTLAPPPAVETTAPESPPAAEAPATPAASKKPAKLAGNYLVQIGSYKSQDEANASWRDFKAKYALVGGYRSDVKQVELGEKGTWYRLRIGPFADKDAANTLCAKLKADGASCLLAR